MNKNKAVSERMLSVTIPTSIKKKFDSVLKANGLKQKEAIARLMELYGNKEITL